MNDDISPDGESYTDFQDRIKSEQTGKDYDQIKEQLQGQTNIVAELDNLPQQNHIWVNRGVFMSCEGASHPNHHSYIRRR